MSELNRLRELAALFQPKAAPVVESTGSKISKDFDGIKRIVDDSLGDLHDKLGEGGALETLLDKAGLTALDKNADTDGATILERLAVRTAQYKKEVDNLLIEVELMLASDSSMNEAKEDQSEEIEAYGVKGMKSTPWRKKFKNRAALEKWIDKMDGDVEVYGTSELNED